MRFDLDKNEFESVTSSGTFVRAAWGTLEKTRKPGHLIEMHYGGKEIGRAELVSRHIEHYTSKIMLIYSNANFSAIHLNAAQAAETGKAGKEKPAKKSPRKETGRSAKKKAA